MSTSGLYIVTLRNREPISVNAHDKRRAERSIKVTLANCKVGQTDTLERRKKNYDRTFGEENVIFQPIVALREIVVAERKILERLDPYLIRGVTGRRNEWLQGIEPERVYEVVLDALKELGIQYEVLANNFRR